MPANGSLEEQVRQRYRQPKGVEQFGIEPIPDRLKTVRWFDLFLIVVNFLINPGTILISGLGVDLLVRVPDRGGLDGRGRGAGQVAGRAALTVLG